MEPIRTAHIIVRPSAELGGPGVIDAVMGACAIDISAGPEGTLTTLSREGDSLVMKTEASDTASFRAALNGHLRCLALAMDVSSHAAADDEAQRK